MCELSCPAKYKNDWNDSAGQFHQAISSPLWVSQARPISSALSAPCLHKTETLVVLFWHGGDIFLSSPPAPAHADGMRVNLFGALLLAMTAPAAESLENAYARHGRLIVTSFASAPFPHPSRAAGHPYQGEFYSAEKHYADHTVALFIPKDYRETGHVDFVVHFHGWRNTVAGTLQQFKLIEQFAASGRNAVLLVPAGPRDAPDSAGGKLEDPEGFRRFMDEALTTLRQRAGFAQSNLIAGGIILSGHSGGYRVMAAILDCGGLTAQVREVWLFDALYAQADKFLAWSEKPGGRLVNIYTDGGGTKIRTGEIMSALKQRGASFLATTDRAVTVPELTTNKFVFLHTDLGHNEVVAERKTFCQLLQTSFLEEIVKH